MTSPYERRKEPERVRRSLIDCAAVIAAERGVAAVTVAAVAKAAGVTKGALFHHFLNKQALVDTMFDELMATLDEEIDDLIAADPVPEGRFTRAYVRVAMTMDDTARRTWSALVSTLTGHTGFTATWHRWLAERLRRHADTDGGQGLEIVRIAADGAWLMSLTGPVVIDVPCIRDRLLAMTTGEAVAGRSGADDAGPPPIEVPDASG